MGSGVRGRGRRRALVAAAFAVTTHLAILGLFLYAMPRILSDARERRAISLDIVASPLVQKRTISQPRLPRPDHDLAGPDAREAPPVAILSPPHPANAEPAMQAPSASPETADSAALGRALRGGIIGCRHADLANLTDAERQHCRDSFVVDRGNTADLSQSAVPPEKRAVFDAAWTADHSPQHMAGVACLAVFGGGKLSGCTPPRASGLAPCPAMSSLPRPHSRSTRRIPPDGEIGRWYNRSGSMTQGNRVNDNRVGNLCGIRGYSNYLI